jgi:secreted trypsin-like serine protease
MGQSQTDRSVYAPDGHRCDPAWSKTLEMPFAVQLVEHALTVTVLAIMISNQVSRFTCSQYTDLPLRHDVHLKHRAPRGL